MYDDPLDGADVDHSVLTKNGRGQTINSNVHREILRQLCLACDDPTEEATLRNCRLRTSIKK